MSKSITTIFLLSAVVPLMAQSPPPQAAGYQLVFTDDFNNLDLSTTGLGSHRWYPGIWWESGIPSPSLISGGNSGLDLQWSRYGGMSDTSISTLSRDGRQGQTFRYGYFEARMKWDVVNGAWPAFWMLPKQVAEGSRESGEIDIFEGEGSDPRQYNGTLHEWNGDYNVWTSSPNWHTLPANNDFSEWHTYGALWVPGRVTWYYDDQPVITSATTAVFDQQDFFLVFSMNEGSYWNQGSLYGVQANQLNLNVAWVRAWQNIQ